MPNEGKWEVGPTAIELTELGQELFGVPNLVRDASYDTPARAVDSWAQNIQEMHRDHVPTVPPTLELLGSTPVTLNQGMVRFYPGSRSVDSVQIFTVQGHPEFTRRIVDALVDAREKTGVLNAEIVADVRRRADWRNDGVNVVGQVIWRILGVSG